jgi:cell division septal protein FtsQ
VDSEPLFLRRGQVAPKKRRSWRAGRALLLLTLVTVAGAGLARFLGGSLFALARFEISGNQRTRTEEILRALDPWKSRNLVMLDLGPVAAKLRTLPWISRVMLAKKFPDGLSVSVAERRPVALLRDKSGLSFLDSRGILIAPYDPRGDRTEYVLVTGDSDRLPEAMELLEKMRVGAPEYFSSLSEISALPDGGFGIMDSIFRRPIRVLGFDAPEKIKALLKARSLIESRGWEARAIDLRFLDRIVLEGAYGAGNTL